MANELSARSLVADLTDANAAASVVNRVVEEAGRIDTLVINAGTLADGLVAGLSDEDLSKSTISTSGLRSECYAQH